MEENKFGLGSINVDWEKLLEGYAKASEDSKLVLPSFPQFSISPEVDSSICATRNWVFGDIYAKDLIERQAVITWRVQCLATCYGDVFFEGFEYNAVELQNGILFVQNDEGEYICVDDELFLRLEMVMSKSESMSYAPTGWKYDVGLDWSNGNSRSFSAWLNSNGVSDSIQTSLNNDENRDENCSSTSKHIAYALPEFGEEKNISEQITRKSMEMAALRWMQASGLKKMDLDNIVEEVAKMQETV